MAQSYGNPSISALLGPVDSILATTKVVDTSLQAGYSDSAVLAATTVAAGVTLTINMNGTGVQTIILAGTLTSGQLIAAEIQKQLRLLGFVGAVCTYNAITEQYTILSETTGAASSVVVTGGTAAASLKLGLANGGAEAAGSLAAGVLYGVHYFLTDAGRYISAEILVEGSEMINHTDMNELKAIANVKARDFKNKKFGLTDTSSAVVVDVISGPVTL